MYYNRDNAVRYAEKWALARNPDYYDFDSLGGDCTNFVSQCLYAGSGVMNYNGDFGWYYNSLNDRAPAWTAAEFLRTFLLTNTQVGPMATQTTIANLEIGDIIALSNGNEYYHSLIVVDVSGRVPLVCAHTGDSYFRPLDTYYPESFSPLHIIGVNKY
ncbi:MAG: amidase domain-containing protein [Eubacterium sp.]